MHTASILETLAHFNGIERHSKVCQLSYKVSEKEKKQGLYPTIKTNPKQSLILKERKAL